MEPITSLDSVAHIIQVALTPIFLLSGVATLLGAFATRLGRVADRVDDISTRIESADDATAARLSDLLAILRRRSLVLDAAVVLAAIGGIATCGAALVLFVGALRDAATGWTLFGLFGFAVICTIGALAAFVTEMLIAGKGLRAEVSRSQDVADASDLGAGMT